MGATSPSYLANLNDERPMPLLTPSRPEFHTRTPSAPPLRPDADNRRLALVRPGRARLSRHAAILLSLWLAVFFASLFSPPLLDDADATHAQAARNIALTGDWVTLHVDGIRYLEKPPLPYWLAALSMRAFGYNTFAVHFPIALAVLALALLGYIWARHAFNERTAFYTALATLTCCGVFLFTRIFIPEALLSLFLCTALYALLRIFPAEAAEKSTRRLYPYVLWIALACAVLTKGFVSLVFFVGTVVPFLWLTGDLKHWRRLKPVTGLLLFLAIAAPWHVLASLRNTGGANGHGFAWFYFINEHVLRFLGKREPRDYNKLPGYLYWSLHLVWLFPWSLFVPVGLVAAWRTLRVEPLRHFARRNRTVTLLAIYSSLILVFFAISTNQEYYTYPIYLPLLLLIAASIVRAESVERSTESSRSQKALIAGHIAFTAIGLATAGALSYGLWSARNYPFVADIGDLLAHRGVGDYTLSMSHFFDLTGPSFAALRLPAALALAAFAVGPLTGLLLRLRRRHFAATLSLAATSAVFLIAAHIALVRFAPMLSSKDLAEKIEELADDGYIDRDNDILLFGDQAYGSSIPFYLNEEVELVDGRSTSMLFGSTFPDAPPIFISSQQLAAEWGHGRRKILFVPLEKRDEVDRLLGTNQYLLEETSGKRLITDQPLNISGQR